MLPGVENNIRHHETQALVFGGLNLTNDTRDGELADSLRVSTIGYPWIRTSKGMEQSDAYGSYASDVFVWNGDIYTVRRMELLKNWRTRIGTVTAGQKKMAVVNTKLVIYPDKIYVDLTDDTIHSLIKESHYWSSGYTITSNSLTANNIGTYYSAGDVVDITGTGIEGLHIVVKESTTNMLTFEDGAITLDNYSGRVTIKSSVPDLDFICSADNRLWGVSNTDKTVYVSALGDPTSFFDYSNDSGSYSVAIGSAGDFTGICNFGGAVLVWKEDMLHKFLGSYPSEYYVIDYPIFGVQKGSDRSMVVINNVLFYKGVYGVYQYGGNRPVLISAKLGKGVYTNAVACGTADYYYISMADPDGEYHLYAYDLQRNMWLKKSNDRIIAASVSNMTAFVVRDTGDEEGGLYVMDETVVPDHNTSWAVELVEVTENIFNRKGYTKLLVRLDMPTWSTVKVYAKEDRKEYREIFSKENLEKKYLYQDIAVSALESIAVDDLPKAGDSIVFSCSAYEGEQEGVWRTSSYGLMATVSFDALKYIDVKCYTDPESEKYKTIEFDYTWDGSLDEEISVWVPTFPDSPVTMLVPI